MLRHIMSAFLSVSSNSAISRRRKLLADSEVGTNNSVTNKLFLFAFLVEKWLQVHQNNNFTAQPCSWYACVETRDCNLFEVSINFAFFLRVVQTWHLRYRSSLRFASMLLAGKTKWTTQRQCTRMGNR